MTLEERPVLSVLISVFGQADKLSRCLNCLHASLAGKIPYEVLLIDDGSDAETIAFLKSLDARHHVRFNDSNHGFAFNNNRMAEAAAGRFLCLLNSDAYVSENWLWPMMEVFDRHPNAGLVGNVQRLAGSLKYDHMGVVFGPRGNPNHFGQGFLFHPFSSQPRKWSAVTAACALVRRELFLQNGGFDENYLNGCEDVDLCLRLSRLGYCHFVAHKSVIEHVKGASEGRKRHNSRNAELLQRRWSDSICKEESLRDRGLYALTHLHRFLFSPHKANFNQLIDIVKIVSGIR